MAKLILARLGLALFLAGALSCASFGAGATVQNSGENPFKHLIDIGGGHHLNMVCTGTGSPTVVFLQGHTGDITNWSKVREPVSALARTCFYDRAGMGYSDPSGKPMTAGNIAEDLHALLRAARIKRPVILAGHSMGGLFATLYADKFPSEVAGLVLIDPSFDGQFDYTVSDADQKTIRQSSEQWISLLKACTKLAREGQLSERQTHDCFHPPSGLTPDETGYVMQQVNRPSYYAGLRSEYENFLPVNGRTIDGDQDRKLKHRFGNPPLIVLTGGLTFDNATVSDAGKKAMKDVWSMGHDKLARRSTRGESIMIPDSGHFVQLAKPDQVVDAIRKVISQAQP